MRIIKSSEMNSIAEILNTPFFLFNNICFYIFCFCLSNIYQSLKAMLLDFYLDLIENSSIFFS